MHSIELNVAAGREAEQFHTAVYRFIELKGSLETAPQIMIRSETVDGVERKVVTLWSEAATTDFRRFWQDFKVNRHAQWSSRYELEGWA